MTFVRSPTIDEARVRADHERLEAGEARPATTPPGRGAAGGPSTARTIASDVLGRRAAAAADEVDEAVLGERAQVAARVCRPARRRGRARSGAPRSDGTRRTSSRRSRELLEERPHLGRAERAVHADDERLGVLDGDPEGVGRLTRQVASALVDGGEREPERQLGRDDRCAATIAAFAFSVSKIVSMSRRSTPPSRSARICSSYAACTWSKRDGAVGSVLDLRRERERHVQRADRAGDEARLVGARAVHASAAARASRAPSRLISRRASSSA